MRAPNTNLQMHEVTTEEICFVVLLLHEHTPDMKIKSSLYVFQ